MVLLSYKVSEDYGIGLSDAETVVLGMKLRAKEILMQDAPGKLRTKYRIKEIK